MSFSSFYSVVNAIKDKSAEAMTTLSSDLQDFKAIVQEDVAELSKTVREGRLSVDSDGQDAEEKTQDDDQDAGPNPKDPTETQDEDDDDDPLTSLKNSLFSFDVTSTLGSLNSVGSSMQGSLTSVGSSMQGSLTSVGSSMQGSLTSVGSSMQGSLTSVGSKLTSLNVGSSLGSLEAMGSKLLNSADEFLGSLAREAAFDDDDELSESELSARRFRLLALQEDSETYSEPPLDVETFEKWKATTPAEDLAEIQKEVLENYPTVGTKFTELVPSIVEADVFWAHYIYKASLLAAQEQRGADLLEHALNDDEEEIGWDVDSPKAKEDEENKFFPDDESKEEDKAPANSAAPGPTSSSDGESWIELDERKESTSSGASSSRKEPASALADLKLEEGDENADALDWGDDDDISVPETATAAASDAKAPEATPATHEDASKRGEDWGEWD